jgi:hypothetical protein
MLNWFKKLIVLIGVIMLISLLSFSRLNAQTSNSESYLYYITQYTYGTLQAVNNLPNYINSWLKQDDSDSTKQIQGSFATLGDLIIQNMEFQNTSQLPITADLFGLDLATLKNPAKASQILNQIPNLNDLSYSTMVGKPPLPKAPGVANAPYNYIKYASGLMVQHSMPSLRWKGPVEAQKKYSNYYNTLMSAESFGAYALSGLLAEAQNGGAFTTTQTALITQASGSSWIAQVATEELGKVLRQLLMFESQSYVLLTQLVQTQKQLVSAQVMTNALLILTMQPTEILLSSKAQGINPS